MSSSTAKQTPREHRAKHLKPDYARASRLARERAQISQRQLAASLQLQQPMLARTELGHEPHAVSVLHVASATSESTRPWAVELVRWQAGHLHLQVMPVAAIEHGDDHARRLASVLAECTDVPRALAEALVDGVIDAGELERVEREAQQASAALLELQAWCADRKRRNER